MNRLEELNTMSQTSLSEIDNGNDNDNDNDETRQRQSESNPQQIEEDRLQEEQQTHVLNQSQDALDQSTPPSTKRDLQLEGVFQPYYQSAATLPLYLNSSGTRSPTPFRQAQLQRHASPPLPPPPPQTSQSAPTSMATPPLPHFPRELSPFMQEIILNPPNQLIHWNNNNPKNESSYTRENEKQQLLILPQQQHQQNNEIESSSTQHENNLLSDPPRSQFPYTQRKRPAPPPPPPPKQIPPVLAQYKQRGSYTTNVVETLKPNEYFAGIFQGQEQQQLPSSQPPHQRKKIQSGSNIESESTYSVVQSPQTTYKGLFGGIFKIHNKERLQSASSLSSLSSSKQRKRTITRQIRKKGTYVDPPRPQMNQVIFASLTEIISSPGGEMMKKKSRQSNAGAAICLSVVIHSFLCLVFVTLVLYSKKIQELMHETVWTGIGLGAVITLITTVCHFVILNPTQWAAFFGVVILNLLVTLGSLYAMYTVPSRK